MITSVDSKLDDLDYELDRIFSDSSRDEFGFANVQNLVDICADKYANGDLDVRNILHKKMDPFGLCPLLSRAEFKQIMKDFISSSFANEESDAVEIKSEDILSHTSYARDLEKYESICDSCKARESYSVLTVGTNEPLFEKLKILKGKNVLLENILANSDQKVLSLEKKLIRLRCESTKKYETCMAENERMETLLSELKEKYSHLEKKYNKLTADYERVEVELNKLKGLEKAYEETKSALLITKKVVSEKNSDLKMVEIVNSNLLEKYEENCKSKEILVQKIENHKIAITQLTNNQAELLARIESLKSEKEDLAIELADIRSYEVYLKQHTPQPTAPDKVPQIDSHEDNCFVNEANLQEELEECGCSVDSFGSPLKVHVTDDVENSITEYSWSSNQNNRMENVPAELKETCRTDLKELENHSVSTYYSCDDNVISSSLHCEGSILEKPTSLNLPDLEVLTNDISPETVTNLNPVNRGVQVYLENGRINHLSISTQTCRTNLQHVIDTIPSNASDDTECSSYPLTLNPCLLQADGNLMVSDGNYGLGRIKDGDLFSHKYTDERRSRSLADFICISCQKNKELKKEMLSCNSSTVPRKRTFMRNHKALMVIMVISIILIWSTSDSEVFTDLFFPPLKIPFLAGYHLVFGE